MNNTVRKHPSSFKDPSGFVFEYKSKIYRQVNKVYAENYTLFKSSGLYDKLLGQNRIISHDEVHSNFTASEDWYLTLLPEQIDLISWPYEWSFDQLKDAALLTLDITKVSVEYGMILKDATPFNIQFFKGSAVFIDTLSFEKYDSSQPWIAYRQFVECFVIPLLLSHYKSPDLVKLLQLYPNGIPISLAAKLLPFKSGFNLNVFLHVFMPEILSKNKRESSHKYSFSRQKLLNIINNLYSWVSSLKLHKAKGRWDNYYDITVLSDAYVREKEEIVGQWLDVTEGKVLMDIGTNTGLFALSSATVFESVIAIDADPACINELYLICKKEKNNKILPLCIDIAQPTPAIGWKNEERSAFLARYKVDVTLALALIHHLVIGKNISMEMLAEMFSKMTTYLIIEFVSENDPKVLQMTRNRKGALEEYTEALFEKKFTPFFEILEKKQMSYADRSVFLMKKRFNAYTQ